ncbi:CapA family protein [cf. Phormidesmis sp. LEGE 11477]|uniref:CapA family protein n=1 Tax=cf. Phormidesmis sp. LEGE 11477 TaxID=1828680 RepID=UPI001880B07C
MASRPISFTLKVAHPVAPDDFFSSSFSQAGFSGLDVRQLAAEGYFQAIAYLLNQDLVPQNIYAQVSRSSVAGRVKIVVEFERSPQPKRLTRFICDRLYNLDSNLIEGVHLVARTVGSSKTDWEERIRIPTVSQRQSPSSAISSAAISSETRPERLVGHADSDKLIHESARSKIARQIVRSQFKFFRAALLSGTAMAAFLFGGLTDLILSERLSNSVASPEVSLPPWYEDGSSTAATEAAAPEATSVRFTSRTVEAALETVSVIPHQAVALPQDPTVTLLFGGKLGLDDFVFESEDSLDQLFSELGIYKRADVAMLGLSEPLATPSTSLQESFYHRTRPEAVQALKAGGVDIVNLASEGIFTYGVQGLKETLKTLDQEGIYRVGAGRDHKEAHRPEILEVKGQRIAYLSYKPRTLKAAKENAAGVASASAGGRQHILEDIAALRSQVDWIVVNYRWGEAEPAEDDLPAEWQQSLARDAIDAGADLVVGYHPSQIQGAEIYRDRAIAYSLGDFVFNEAPFENHDSVALRVSLRNRQMKIEFLPVTIRDSRLQMATGERGSAILQSIRQASRTFEQPMQFPAVLKAQAADSLTDLPPMPDVSTTRSIDQSDLDPAHPIPRGQRSVQPLPTAASEPFIAPADQTINPIAEPVLTPDFSRHEVSNPSLHESDALFLLDAEGESSDLD